MCDIVTLGVRRLEHGGPNTEQTVILINYISERSAEVRCNYTATGPPTVVCILTAVTEKFLGIDIFGSCFSCALLSMRYESFNSLLAESTSVR